MSETYEFLKKAGTFYLATVDRDKPRVRPFGFVMEYEGRLYFGGGDHKEFYRQLQANPELEISACVGPEWIRLRGKAHFDLSEEALEEAWRQAPHLKAMYEKTPDRRMALFFVDDASCVWATLSGPETKVLSL